MSDPYVTLGVTRDTPLPDIKKAYKKLAMKHHPDRNDGKDEKFKEVQAAYDQVKDGPPAPDVNEYKFTSASDFSDFFKRHQQQQRQQFYRVNINITLSDAINGGTKYIELTINGQNKSFEIDIPPGTRHGETVRYPNLAEGRDIIISYLILPDSEWEVSEMNLIKSVKVNIWDLILGTEVDVTTIDKKTIRLKVPKGTQPGTYLRVKGKGMRTRQNMLAVGDMLVHIEAIIPDNIPEDIINIIKQHHK